MSFKTFRQKHQPRIYTYIYMYPFAFWGKPPCKSRLRLGEWKDPSQTRPQSWPFVLAIFLVASLAQQTKTTMVADLSLIDFRKLSATDGYRLIKYWFRRFGSLIQGQIYDPDILQTYVPTNTLGFSDHRYHNRNNCFLYADTFSLQLYWLLGRGGYNPTIWYRSSVPSTWFQKKQGAMSPRARWRGVVCCEVAGVGLIQDIWFMP